MKNDTLNFQPAMNTKANLLILSALAVPVSAVLAGRWLVARQTRRDVADLFALADTNSIDTYDPAQLTDLPPPVQRYFRHVLRPGQPYLQTVRLRHNGQFKTDLKKDRKKRSENDYLINLKAEIQIRSMNQKIDILLEEQIKTLFDTQQRQFTLLQEIKQQLDSLASQ